MKRHLRARDVTFTCNKREPGTGCPAIPGENRMHAILGSSDACIATHASDLAVALVGMDARLHLRGPSGERIVPLVDFYREPGNTPHIENVRLEPGMRAPLGSERRGDSTPTRRPW